MRKFNFLFGVLFIAFSACKSSKTVSEINTNTTADFTIAFGSCNKQKFKNKLWQEVVKHKPNVWIWGGDNIYADTDDMQKLQAEYNKQLQQEGYSELVKNTTVLGTWDDHDYGVNDGGTEFYKKAESQQLFLDFFNVPKNDTRRKQEGVYHSEYFKNKQIKVIVLDTRYFRTALTKDNATRKRYKPNKFGEGTILGEQQWQWLENELKSSQAQFNIIVSSVQFLSAEHGFETWGNFPHEVEKLQNLLQTYQPKGVILISGDRHISEFSKAQVPNLSYPLIDFTSSGLTHSYSNFTYEANKYRTGKVVSDLSFGLLQFNLKTKTVTMQMRGLQNKLQQELIQKY